MAGLPSGLVPDARQPLAEDKSLEEFFTDERVIRAAGGLSGLESWLERNVKECQYPVTGDVIRIVPVIIGSKKAGLLQTILGAVLVAVGAVLNFTPWAAASPFLYKFGAAMMIGGVVQMLSPQPAGLASKQSSDNRASYAFGGVTNTAAQGYPVPLLYGRRQIGGAIISAGIYVEDQQ
ncbi:tail assembly protein [Escherichia coli]|nr:tail assembly protein [Escherichia coli]